MDARSQFVDEVERFLRERGMAATRLGRHAINDPHLVRRLRGGADVTLSTADKVRAFMQANAQPQQEAA